MEFELNTLGKRPETMFEDLTLGDIFVWADHYDEFKDNILRMKTDGPGKFPSVALSDGHADISAPCRSKNSRVYKVEGRFTGTIIN